MNTESKYVGDPAAEGFAAARADDDQRANAQGEAHVIAYWSSELRKAIDAKTRAAVAGKPLLRKRAERRESECRYMLRCYQRTPL